MDALEAIVEYALLGLLDAIRTGEEGSSPGLLQFRLATVSLLHKLPVTCTVLRDVARANPCYVPVLWYERVRLGSAMSGHFLEGLGRGLTLFTGLTTLQMPDAQLRPLRLHDIHADRAASVLRLESLPNDDPHFVELAEEHVLEDVPTALPPRVHIFLARMRAVCQGLLRVKPESCFANCENRECGRRFYVGTPLETTPVPGAPPSTDFEDYWAAVASSPAVRCNQRTFCTWSCRSQWQEQFASSIPELGLDEPCRREGRARVGEALRHALRRNEMLSRHLRTTEKSHTYSAIGAAAYRRQRDRFVKMINIDIGLLYAASLLAESRATAANKVLPGASPNWRSRPAFYLRSIRCISRLYDRSHRNKTVIYNLLLHQPFLEKLRTTASSLF